jgi:hypothetical protein
MILNGLRDVNAEALGQAVLIGGSVAGCAILDIIPLTIRARPRLSGWGPIVFDRNTASEGARLLA